MPSLDEQGYSPYADTYGFMVNKDCPYPNCAKAFMNMVRSKAGIQAYLDHNDGVVLLQKEDISDWMYTRGDKIYGGYTIDPLLVTYPKEEADEWQSFMEYGSHQRKTINSL